MVKQRTNLKSTKSKTPIPTPIIIYHEECELKKEIKSIKRITIDSLEIENFKSFAGRTVIDLHSSFTAIVGPNGSGKSNIVDAVRFVFEAKSKHMRLKHLQDVIHRTSAEGTEPALEASVHIHFAWVDEAEG